jgi:hypothetical protein
VRACVRACACVCCVVCACMCVGMTACVRVYTCVRTCVFAGVNNKLVTSIELFNFKFNGSFFAEVGSFSVSQGFA